MNRLRQELFDQAPSCLNSFTMIALDKRDIRGQSSFRILLAHGKQLQMIDLLQEVFNLIVIIRFISKNNRTIWKLIGIIFQGIHIAKATRGQETFNRLSILGHHQMDLESIKIPFLAGLIASKVFMGVYLGSPNTDIVTYSNRDTINHIDSILIECFPGLR